MIAKALTSTLSYTRTPAGDGFFHPSTNAVVSASSAAQHLRDEHEEVYRGVIEAQLPAVKLEIDDYFTALEVRTGLCFSDTVFFFSV